MSPAIKTSDKASLSKITLFMSLKAIIPKKELSLWGESVKDRTKSIANFLLKKLVKITTNLAIKENYKLKQNQSIINRPCFSVSFPNELVINNKKVIGFAQRVLENGVIVQGTIPLTDSYRDILLYKKCRDREQELKELSQNSQSLKEVLNRDISYNDIKSCFIL